jgi:hypothetical protein
VDAIRRRKGIESRSHPAWTPSKCRHRPDFSLAEYPPVIDFLAIGREIVHKLVALVRCELKRLAPGSKHEKHLRDAAYERSKRDCMTVG